MAQKLLNFFVYTSVYITTCALVMIWQTNYLLDLHYLQTDYYLFVLFSTICSYNFHWYLTPDSPDTHSERVRWGGRNRWLMMTLCMLAGLGAAWYFWQLKAHWLEIAGAVFLTFLYSAPKVPHKSLRWLSKIAIGKTLFLTFVWTYVTTLLPALIADNTPLAPTILFTLHRFALIYAICILFDRRDIEEDRQAGIRSLITHLPNAQLRKVYYGSLLLALITALGLYPYTDFVGVVTLLIAVAATALITRKAWQDNSDYLYYVVLDGFMMLSALLHLGYVCFFSK
ncbi:UbiA prenyltransferase family protein [Chitinophaga jiangningensis]|uniref:UbiA prenyltransferase family protein n=1 Tax=Chitinophaga jiangningensis TaxID=1419482 RepID=A0A1M7CQ76_9BACT|nr:UbiA family prenyltransferase [Chitinophaga jiangningensis]SHL69300.1 UbiA prenyltransferase family protein [Chitinophaga jiangningensis]